MGDSVPFLKSLPAHAKVPDALAAFDSGTARPLIEFHQALLRGESPLTVAQRELIAAFVSATNACSYCAGAHQAVAVQFGVPEALLSALAEDVDGAEIEPAMKPLLRYVRKLTLTPARMTAADADDVLAAGWSERALYDAVQVCALFNFMNRFVDGLGIEAVEDDFSMEGRMLHDHGYTGLLDLYGIR